MQRKRNKWIIALGIVVAILAGGIVILSDILQLYYKLSSMEVLKITSILLGGILGIYLIIIFIMFKIYPSTSDNII